MKLGADFIRNFVDQCLRDAGRCLAEFEQAGAAEDWEKLREAAHALKGVAENLGAQTVVRSCTDAMRSSNPVLAREWRRRLGALDAQLQASAERARAEVARLASGSGDSDQLPNHDSR